MSLQSFAAIDMGSNTVKVTMWKLHEESQPEVVYRHRYPIRLGRGTFAEGRLGPKQVEAALDTAHHLRGVATNLGIDTIRGVATAALRAANNGGEVARQIAAETGIEIEIISSDREGELTARGALMGMDLSHGAAIVDIGGGSAEVTLTQAGDTFSTISLPLGAVLLTEAHLPDDPPTSEELEKLQIAAREIVGCSGICPSERVVVGCGGTLVSVGLMVTAMHTGRDQLDGNEIPPISVEHLDALYQKMITLNAEQRAERFDLEHQRAEIIIAGVVALRELLRALGASDLQVTSRGLREGLLLEFLNRES